MNNTFFLKSAPLLLAASLALFGANAAHAGGSVTINYTAGVFQYTAPSGDADFYGRTRSQTLTLAPGVAQTVNLQAVYLDAFDTNDYNDYIDTFSRNLTVNGITQSVVQKFDLTTDFGDGQSTFLANDSLIFYPGQATTFDLGSQGILTFTPETLDTNGIFNADSGTYFDNVKGKFLLTPAAAVPEASTTVSFGLLLTLGGLGLLAARSRKRSSANV